MIHFQCEHCGRKLRVPQTHAGKSGRCPYCRNRITVPQSVPPEPTGADDIQLLPADVMKQRDDALLDRPPARAQDEAHLDARQQDRELLASLGVETLPEHTGERKRPWPIDIFLYPISSGGLTAVGLILGLMLLTIGLRYIRLQRLVGTPLFLLDVVVGLYMGWYLAECVYDSARGGTRAPPGFEPGLAFGDIWSRVSYLLAVYVVYLFPVVFYRMFFGELNAIFWALAAWAIVFFPMGLLAMVMHDSTSALNPFFLLGSILRTFIPYLALLMLFGSLASALLYARVASTGQESSILLDVTAVVPTAYVPFVLAHVLGRFHWRYRARLDWGT